MARCRPLRHHVPPSWELYEYRDGRWVPVFCLREPAQRGRLPSPSSAKEKMRPEKWVMRRAARLLTEMIRKRREADL
ncbi:MAG: hypothetical protein QXK89_01485 [Candidatus Bathyarchaeia archaeon]